MMIGGKHLYEQGLAREKAGDMTGAFEFFRRSALADTRIAAPYVGLARVLLHNQQRAQAIACLERAVGCEPGNDTIHILMGQALAQDGQLDRAQTAYQQALHLDPYSANAAIGLAGVYEALGDRETAAKVYGDLLELAPDDGEALAGLLAVAEGDSLDRAVSIAKVRLADAPDQQAALIAYSLGKVLARKGDHDGAHKAWVTANTARRRMAGPFDHDLFNARIQNLINVFSADFFAARPHWGNPSRCPVFVVGLPRSGTTLTEQILASHPAVFGAGELDVLTDLATGTPDRLGRANPPWPEAAPELTHSHIQSIADDHLSRLIALTPGRPSRIIDKQPLNFWHLGLLALTFPNARVIHCTRDIRDNGLSIFAENFREDQRWATDYADMACYVRGYRRLMDHWRTVSGLNILDVSYEQTVDDLETQARRLLNFLNLDWDSGVLAFHKSDRAVQTPSRWQVRTPLYASSVGRWRPYATHMAPLLALSESTL